MPVLRADGIRGFDVAPDGESALFTFTTADGEDFGIHVPAGSLPMFMLYTALAEMKVRQNRGDESVAVFPVEGFFAGLTPDRSIFTSLTVASGARFVFGLDDETARTVRDAMDDLLGRSELLPRPLAH